MKRKSEVVKVLINGHIVGQLALTPDYLCAFEYDASWIHSGYSISPFHLPLKPGLFIARRDPFQGLFGVFNDSLPDGWGMLLTDRYLKEKQIDPSTLNILERLCLVGKSGMGALEYQPAYNVSGLNKKSDLNQLAKEVENILNEQPCNSLDELFIKGGSSGGAQPKVLVYFDDAHWIVKFRSSIDPLDIGEQEYQYSLIAKKCGIDMPETQLFEGKFFGTKRFDLQGNTRYHVHSASGLLYASYRYPSLDYTELIKASISLTRNIEEAYKVFRQMVFNVLTYNRDDHAKNFSFILKNKEWHLSLFRGVAYHPENIFLK
jgi:serine/threonine-protein kinase HipA